ncbi:2-aminoethylphosphonate--pyruvate transaminase [Staphylococcus nepalensis]|uniref:2-aminoethylphosphonate--pyruvate transaminase n=1 Tax=Staphylococcus nepalensis TaxID=214473 RepID=UPI00226FD18F|nr:2-aminoethylphosphonate--pyruvate transaminase [Staphylococcus nepalensis]MCY1038311.1 2-aminoethylphosphonate--pyruvate transaminase [Staphylococcus nepalensis]
MEQLKLLTPGPLTTSDTVKREMLIDRCTWDDDYKNLTQSIQQRLLDIAKVDAQNYTSILQQGSGSFVVESIIQTALSPTDHILIISNGAYGKRMIEMAYATGKNVTELNLPYNEVPSVGKVKQLLEKDATLTHIAVVHCETTTGILNPIEAICELARKFDKKIIIDAMSSFGGIPIEVEELDIDFLVSSANKCIQGVPGFGFVIAKRQSLEQTKGNARSVSLDLYEQWSVMKDSGKWRYTSPTHVVAAFYQAIIELENEGGVHVRNERYASNNQFVIQSMKRLGFEPYIDNQYQSPIITTFLYPNQNFDFDCFYEYMKKHHFVLYPGKLMETPSFRIGNIGDLHRQDFENMIQHIENYKLKE